MTTRGARRVNAHGVRQVFACVRARSAPGVRVRTLAECAVCARADARGVRRVRARVSRLVRSGHSCAAGARAGV